ncbi:T-cell surface glycoprotein CD3 delta chain-like isoform X2 [Toxotes jaculatrix]|uniref:T-cell surface glycoprotein CD3 delta chain-like isoform X2 n=1 Tax=Toxotes jaculatrix TaxID=941984 RepID=UPI001B3A7C95|nr:T-cell surface glycoprotein CD3 delta chain-like isoform X2 [Toxotes jaculatrix]XP_040901480.1 T-cell surface glycoprotein CD3 delta chain-like isoform X2 [Toxotes jaculatrix]
MKCQLVLSACLLVLWTLTAFVTCDDEKFKVVEKSDGIEVTCPNNGNLIKDDKDVNKLVRYDDMASGEYICSKDDSLQAKIFVKMRTCDNCIELDIGSVFGLVMGDVVATIAIGVAVYLIAAYAQTGRIPSNKSKSSDRQHLVSNDMTSRAPGDHYERLRHKGGQKDTYDVINHRQ